MKAMGFNHMNDMGKDGPGRRRMQILRDIPVHAGDYIRYGFQAAGHAFEDLVFSIPAMLQQRMHKRDGLIYRQPMSWPINLIFAQG